MCSHRGKHILMVERDVWKVPETHSLGQGKETYRLGPEVGITEFSFRKLRAECLPFSASQSSFLAGLRKLQPNIEQFPHNIQS